MAESSLPTDWWTISDVATYLGIAPSTVRSYLARSQMPEPDRHIGRTAVWKPKTIRAWNSRRPRVGGPAAT